MTFNQEKLVWPKHFWENYRPGRRAWKVIIHPIFIFVCLQVFAVAVIAIWWTWYYKRKEELSLLKELTGSVPFKTDYLLTLVIIGCVFLGVIALGTIVLFVYLLKQRQLLKMQRTFLSSVSHELRSPLASLQLSLETLQTRTLDVEMQKRLLHMAEADRQRLSRLVEQILLSTRLDLGKTQIHEMRAVSLKALLVSAKKTANHLAPDMKKRIHIVCNQNQKVWLPFFACQLILGNLIENAVKYSPSGSDIYLEASLSKSLLSISVKDQGYGISRGDRKKIFKMFHRGEIAEQKAIPGTGLGLFIVKSIVKSIRGKIMISSSGSNKGSVFIFSIPVEEQLGDV